MMQKDTVLATSNGQLVLVDLVTLTSHVAAALSSTANNLLLGAH